MIFDKQLMFSENQDLSQDAGTYYSNTVDLWGGFSAFPQTSGATGPLGELGGPRSFASIQHGKTPIFYAVMTEALSTGSSPTLRLYFQTGTAIDGSNNLSGGTIVTHLDTTALTASSTVWSAGYTIKLALNGVALKRYAQVKYVIANATTTTGTITAGITFDGYIPSVTMNHPASAS